VYSKCLGPDFARNVCGLVHRSCSAATDISWPAGTIGVDNRLDIVGPCVKKHVLGGFRT